MPAKLGYIEALGIGDGEFRLFAEFLDHPRMAVTFQEGDAPCVVAYHLCELAKKVLALERSDIPPEPRVKDPPPTLPFMGKQLKREDLARAPRPLRREDEP